MTRARRTLDVPVPRPALAGRRWLRQLTALGLAIVASLGASPMVAPPASASGPGYVTLMFGRTQWVTTDVCVPMPDTVALDAVAAELASRGLLATGSVIVNRTSSTSTQYCKAGYTTHPTWDQLAMLRDTYGWTFVSGGAAYRDMTKITPQQQWTESCGTIATFASHGHERAWGLFAYPNNKWTTAIQTDVVSTCFSYGRTYAGGRNRLSEMGPPWFQKTVSVNGGACNDPALACYDLGTVGVNRRYRSPDSLASVMNVRPDQWVVIQNYRFVTDAYTGRFFRWDCSSPDWRAHWTNNAELYCWGDYLSAISRIPAGAVVTDPATVAIAWGRGNPNVGP